MLGIKDGIKHQTFKLASLILIDSGRLFSKKRPGNDCAAPEICSQTADKVSFMLYISGST